MPVIPFEMLLCRNNCETCKEKTLLQVVFAFASARHLGKLLVCTTCSTSDISWTTQGVLTVFKFSSDYFSSLPPSPWDPGAQTVVGEGLVSDSPDVWSQGSVFCSLPSPERPSDFLRLAGALGEKVASGLFTPLDGLFSWPDDFLLFYNLSDALKRLF